MRPRNELWQGYFGYWQSRFTHHNILTIGYTAWNGYRNQGRGMVVCEVVDVIPPTIDWSVDIITFNRAFIPEVEVGSYLPVLELEPQGVTALLTAIATYHPAQAIVLLIIGNGTVDINILQNLAISPSECCKQVERRWSEFESDLTPQRRHL
jgi:hypothetical protein